MHFIMNQERLVTVTSDLGGEKQQKLHFPMMENDEYQKAQIGRAHV